MYPSKGSSLSFVTVFPTASSRHHTRRTVVVCQDPSVAPNFAKGWVPEKDEDYSEVRVLSISRRLKYKEELSPTSLITLAPIKLARKGLKISVSGAQVDSIKSALSGGEVDNARPSTQSLFASIILANNGLVSKVAITHIENDVYSARIWIRTGYRTINVDCRPSDAIAMAIQCQAPVFLNKRLLAKWGVPVKSISKEIVDGIADVVHYHPRSKTSTMIVAENARLPEDKATSLLKSQLDLALRAGRTTEADRLLKELRDVNPLAYLRAEKARAVKEERYKDAEQLDEEITECRVQNWLRRKSEREQGMDDLDEKGKGLTP